MSKLLELADRVEALTGADRDADWRIAKAIGLGRWPDIQMWPPFMVGSAADKEIPRYTASIDAARTLVPEDWRLAGASEEQDGRFQFALFPRNIESYAVPSTFEAHLAFLARCNAATPALALCAASLRARLAVEGEGALARREVRS